MLMLRGGVQDGIRQHSVDSYPHECCGALIGRGNMVDEALALPNMTKEGPRTRFLIRPIDYQVAERRATETGCELVGFYHSHPDHPARPSEYDLEHAWPTFAYVIVTVDSSRAGAMTSWRLRTDRAAFVEEPISVE